jgi:hypothetical protein
MLPAVGFIYPLIRLNKVDLPAPFGPIKACRSPFMMLRLTSRITEVLPKLFCTPRNSTAGDIMRGILFRVRR